MTLPSFDDVVKEILEKAEKVASNFWEDPGFPSVVKGEDKPGDPEVPGYDPKLEAGQRMYFDSALNLVTGVETDSPLYYSPDTRQLTLKETEVPAVFKDEWKPPKEVIKEKFAPLTNFFGGLGFGGNQTFEPTIEDVLRGDVSYKVEKKEEEPRKDWDYYAAGKAEWPGYVTNPKKEGTAFTDESFAAQSNALKEMMYGPFDPTTGTYGGGEPEKFSWMSARAKNEPDLVVYHAPPLLETIGKLFGDDGYETIDKLAGDPFGTERAIISHMTEEEYAQFRADSEAMGREVPPISQEQFIEEVTEGPLTKAGAFDPETAIIITGPNGVLLPVVSSPLGDRGGLSDFGYTWNALFTDPISDKLGSWRQYSPIPEMGGKWLSTSDRLAVYMGNFVVSPIANIPMGVKTAFEGGFDPAAGAKAWSDEVKSDIELREGQMWELGAQFKGSIEEAEEYVAQGGLNKAEEAIRNQELAVEAELKFNLAVGMLENDNPSLAISTMTEAWQAQISRSDRAGVTFRGSWILAGDGAEREEQMINALAEATLQLGRWPTVREIRDVTNLFVDPGAELGYELIFDFTNLIPGFVMEEILVKPVKAGLGLGRDITFGAFKLVAPEAAAWVSDLFRKRAITSAATKFKNNVHEILRNVGRESFGHENFIENIIKIGDIPAGSLEDLSSIGVGTRNFRKILELDGAFISLGREGDGWIKFIEKAQSVLHDEFLSKLDDVMRAAPSEEILEQAAKYASDPQRLAGKAADLMSQAYLDGKRLWKGGPLADSIVGGMAETIAKAFPESANTARTIAKGWMKGTEMIQGLWIKLVLTSRPGFTIRNYIDSGYRALLFGANPFDDIGKLSDVFKSYPDITDNFLTRDLEGLDFIREMLQGKKFKGGLARVWWEGFLPDAVRKGLPKGWWKDESLLRTFGNLFTDARPHFARGFAAVNAAFEFSWRAKLFTKHFTSNFSLMEKMALEGLQEFTTDPTLQELASIIWIQSEYTPGVISRTVDDILKGGEPGASLLLPKTLSDKILTQLDPSDARSFLGGVLGEVRKLVDADDLNPNSIESLFKGLTDDVEEHIAKTIEDNKKLLDAHGGVNQDLDFSKLDDVEEGLTGFGDVAKRETEVVKEEIRSFFGTTEEAVPLTQIPGDLTPLAIKDDFLKGLGLEEKIVKQIEGSTVYEAARRNGAALAERRATIAEEIKRLALGVEAKTIDPAELNYMLGLSEELDHLNRSLQVMLAEYYPGPAFMPFGTSGKRWDRYFEAQAGLYEASTSLFDEAMRLTPEERIAAREAGEMPSAIEFYEKAGWEFKFDDTGRLRALRDKSGARWATSERILSKFQQSIGLYGEEALRAPFLQATKETVSLAEGVITKTLELDEAWEAIIRQSRAGGNLKFWYKDHSSSYESLTKYIQGQIDTAMEKGLDDQARILQRRLSEIEFEWGAHKKVLGHVVDPAPFVPPRNTLPYGIQQWLNTGEDVMARGESMKSFLGEWAEWLKVKEGVVVAPLTQAQKGILLEWAEQATKLKREAIDIAAHGGKFMEQTFEGAIPITNHVMLDYGDFSRFDAIMKKAYPFWMFPSRSLPFWLETVATNPEIAAFYTKYMQFSKRTVIQSGATTTYGDPLPSLSGYIPIPGTDTWFNPLASFSFRYAFPVDQQKYDDPSEDATPTQQIAAWIYENGNMFGLAPPPWTTYPLYWSGVLDEKIFSMWSIIPQVNLIPPWEHRNIAEWMRRIATPEIGDFYQDNIAPEVSWKDYLIERQLLVQALQDMEGMPAEKRMGYSLLIAEALQWNKREENEEAMQLWEAARGHIEGEDYYRSMAGYFTGIYGKEFTDADAQLLRIRDEINMLKWALADSGDIDFSNEEIRKLFGIYEDVEESYNHYLEKRYDTPEGWLNNLYNSIRFIDTPEFDEHGDVLSLQAYKNERLNMLSQTIQEQLVWDSYYTEIGMLQDELKERLSTVAIGDSESRSIVFDWYFETRMEVENNPMYDDAQRTWGPFYKPTVLLEKHFMNLWMQLIRETRPSYNPEEQSYAEYEQELAVWKAGLPGMADRLLPKFMKNVNSYETDLTKDQSVEGVEQMLRETTNAEGYQEWEKANDTPLDALNAAWTALYWDEYWNAVGEVSGSERQLAEFDFMKANPEPPDVDTLWTWIHEEYGDKFTYEQIKTAFGGTTSFDIEERLQDLENPFYSQEDKVWEILNGAGPGPGRTALMDAFEKLGGDPDDISVWYTVGGNGLAWKNPEQFEEFFALLEKASEMINLSPPTRQELVARVEAEALNDRFKEKMKKELGDDIYDLLARYGRMNSTERKEFRNLNQEEYEKIQAYYQYKDEYAEVFPRWADYYHPFFEKVTSTGYSGYFGRGSRRGGGGGRRGQSVIDTFSPMGFRSATATELLKPGEIGRGGVAGRPHWPPGLATQAGPILTQQIKNVEDGTASLSTAGEKMVDVLATQRSEMAPFLKEIKERSKAIYGEI